MTVKELIEELQKRTPTMRVFIKDYDFLEAKPDLVEVTKLQAFRDCDGEGKLFVTILKDYEKPSK